VRKAGTLGVCYFALIVACTLVLAMVEPIGLERLLFEVISAATTTGLSLGITSELSPAGRLVLVAAMFLGRVGPLALLTMLIFGRRTDRPYSYAHEGVALG
jgi:trk system potassium uptake protein TrkH